MWISSAFKVGYSCLLLAIAVAMQGILISSIDAAPRRDISTDFQPNRSSYQPITLPPNLEVNDTLSERDIPIGDAGFARDYQIQLNAGEQIAIDLSSDSFDTLVILMDMRGKTIGKNDDAPDGTSNSLLFSRIKDAGTYIIRVQGFGETSSGGFKLKVSKLRAS